MRLQYGRLIWGDNGGCREGAGAEIGYAFSSL